MQTPTPNAGFTRHLYSVHAARFQRVRACSKETPPHGVLGDCMERLHSVAGVLHILNAVGPSRAQWARCGRAACTL